MGTQEPRIYPEKPRWANLERLCVHDGRVWFKTKYGRISVSEKDVEKYERKQNGGK